MKATISKNFTPDTLFKQTLQSEHFLVRSKALDQKEQKGGRYLGEKYLPGFFKIVSIFRCASINFFQTLINW